LNEAVDLSSPSSSFAGSALFSFCSVVFVSGSATVPVSVHPLNVIAANAMANVGTT
jgi:hypothetical protein